MRRLSVMLVSAVALAVAAGLGQGVPPGFDAASFARLGVGGRALAMAGAYVAVAEGPTAGYWNPAGLAAVPDFQVEGMYTNWLGAGIHLQHIGVAGYPPIGEERPRLRLGEASFTFALNWLSVQVPDIPWLEEDGTYGTFTAWSHLVLLSVAWSIPQAPALSLGISGKLYHDRILEGTSLGLGMDFGLLWQGEIQQIPIQIGLCTTDLGATRVQWYGTTGEPVTYVPWLVRAGVAAWLWEERLLLAMAFEQSVDRPRFERIRLGAEVRLEWLAVRAGWDNPLYGDPARWMVGIGITPWDWARLEYTFLPSPLGDSHWIAFRTVF